MQTGNPLADGRTRCVTLTWIIIVHSRTDQHIFQLKHDSLTGRDVWLNRNSARSCLAKSEADIDGRAGGSKFSWPTVNIFLFFKCADYGLKLTLDWGGRSSCHPPDDATGLIAQCAVKPVLAAQKIKYVFIDNYVTSYTFIIQFQS